MPGPSDEAEPCSWFQTHEDGEDRRISRRVVENIEAVDAIGYGDLALR